MTRSRQWVENGEHESTRGGGHPESGEEHFPRGSQSGNRAQNKHSASGYDGESIFGDTLRRRIVFNVTGAIISNRIEVVSRLGSRMTHAIRGNRIPFILEQLNAVATARLRLKYSNANRSYISNVQTRKPRACERSTFFK